MEKKRKTEVHVSLAYSIICLRCIGVCFTKPKTILLKLSQKLWFTFSVCCLSYHVFGDIVLIVRTIITSPSIVDVVPYFHLFAYAILSTAKALALWQKKDVCGKLINELAHDEVQPVKDRKFITSRIALKCYFLMSAVGVWLYYLSPIGIYFYRNWQGDAEAQVGFVWVAWYPFDKRDPTAHVFVYIFEVFIGQCCVWIMMGTDMLFSGVASHICLLLRVLQKRLENIATTEGSDEESYQEILENVKLHQRLIRYCNDLEDIFTASNLANIILSSVIICCALFVIVLLDPLLEATNKLFLVSTLFQIGVLCWYGDEILHANGDVADSAYNSGWYRKSPRCRQTILFLLVRSQKPIAFTAMKFTNISLVTYGSILTRSYSYFTLLYTIYSK